MSDTVASCLFCPRPAVDACGGEVCLVHSRYHDCPTVLHAHEAHPVPVHEPDCDALMLDPEEDDDWCECPDVWWSPGRLCEMGGTRGQREVAVRLIADGSYADQAVQIALLLEQ